MVSGSIQPVMFGSTYQVVRILEYSVLVMGTPGSGKTTVSRALAEERSGVYFSASRVLDNYSKVDSVAVARWRLNWARGEMAPDDEVLPVLWNGYRECSSRGIVFLDGYPRTEGQLEDFYGRGGVIGMVLFLETSTSVARQRILNRQSEESRVDDKTSLIDSRIAQSLEQIKPLMSDKRIQCALEVIECSNLGRQETLSEALRRYDSPRH